MNFLSDYRRLNSLLESSNTWRLLRAQTSPLILAFLKNVFNDEREVEYERARACLKEYLEDIKNYLDPTEQKRTAKDYLNEWLNKKWIRERENKLTMTDAAQKALIFCEQLDTKVVSTSATHLEILLREVQNLYIQISNDKRARVKEINRQIATLEAEKKLIQQGQDEPLSDYQQKEKIKTLYDLANRLPNDFRRLEEETYEINKALRTKMVQEQSSKGQLISEVLAEEAKQRLTDYGSAYEQFFTLLCEEERSLQFKRQIKHILEQPIAKYLDKKQVHFVGNILDILIKECNRVRKVRARIDENLRVYLESAEYKENKRLSKLFAELEHESVKFKTQKFNMFTKEIDIYLEKGNIRVIGIESLKNALKTPPEKGTIDEIETHENKSVIRDHILKQLDTVKMPEVRKQIRKVLGQASSMTIGQIISKTSLKHGLEEIVAFIRAAREMNTDELLDSEEIVVTINKDGQSKKLCLKLPRIMITSQMAREKPL